MRGKTGTQKLLDKGEKEKTKITKQIT